MIKVIRQVDIQLNPYGGHASNKLNAVTYQNTSTYLTLAISDWVQKKQLELGKFSRVVFEENTFKRFDFEIVNTNVLGISLSETFQDLSQFSNATVTHEYFKQKYQEGFQRLDDHFGLTLTPELAEWISRYFDDRLVYEKEMKSKRIHGLKHQVLKQYKYDAFHLILRVLDKTGEIVKETILKTDKPDPFLIHYRVNKVNLLEDKIQVIGSTGNVESEYSIESL